MDIDERENRVRRQPTGAKGVESHRSDEYRKRRWPSKVVTAGMAVLLGLTVAGKVGAQEVKSYTRQTLEDWVTKYSSAKPDFKAGDTLTAKDMDRLRPFVPPGYIEQLNFPEFKAHIGEFVDHTPAKQYTDCTEKYQNQVRITADGTIQNYVCGQPFPVSSIKADDPQAGMKEAWNWEYRWQNFGTAGYNLIWTWDSFGGSHTPPTPKSTPEIFVTVPLPEGGSLPADTTELYKGGGTFQRNLQSNYQRVYFTHLAQLTDHTLPLPNASDFEFKEIVSFFEPFDIRGTAFITYRYADPNRADDAWAYIPNLRRVRRISAEVKSDSLLGTDHTIEDFYSFSGRTLEWNWKFLGWKDVLYVSDPRETFTHLYGPNGIVPDDDWTVRRVAVIERSSKDPRHPYSSEIMFWDAQNMNSGYSFAYDKKGKLWKVWEWQWKWTESYTGPWAANNKGVRAGTFQSVQVVDVQNNRGTIILGFGFGYPNVSADHVERLYDINKLEESHR